MYNFLVICVSTATLENVHFEVWEKKHELEERLLRLLRRGREGCIHLFLPTIPQRTVPVWIPTWDATSNVFHWKGRRERPTLICYTFMCYTCCYLLEYSGNKPKDDNFEVFTRMLTLSLQSASKSLIALQTETLKCASSGKQETFYCAKLCIRNAYGYFKNAYDLVNEVFNLVE